MIGFRQRGVAVSAAVAIAASMAACGSSSPGPKITAANFCSQLKMSGQNLSSHLSATPISQSSLKGDVRTLDHLAGSGPGEVKGPLQKIASTVNALATQSKAPTKADIARTDGDQSLQAASSAINTYGQNHCAAKGS